MSNVLTIQPTKFEDVRTGEVSFGIRLFDDYQSMYINTWNSIPDDDLEVFYKMMEDQNCADLVMAYFDSQENNDPTIFIGEIGYNRSQIILNRNIKVAFVSNCEIEVIKEFDEEKDEVVSSSETFSIGQQVEFIITGYADKGAECQPDTSLVNVQFGDGSVAYALDMSWFTILKF